MDNILKDIEEAIVKIDVEETTALTRKGVGQEDPPPPTSSTRA